MQVNKKYKSIPLSALEKKQKADAFFPVFLPDTVLFSTEDFGRWYYQLMMARNIAQFAHKSYFPLGLIWADYTNAEESKTKSKPLPLFAKLQRKSQKSAKNLKKNQTFLTSFFPDFQIPFLDLASRVHQDLTKVLELLKKQKVLKHAEKLLYRDISNQSIVSPDFIEWRTEKTYRLEVKCFVETKKEILPLVVDDLFTFFADRGVIVHSNDKRYKKHIGKKIIIPILNKSIPIYSLDGIDTLKDNGIIRLNPLLNPESLQQTQEYFKEVQTSFYDQNGLLTEEFQDFAGKSIFEFVNNVPEILDMIWNLSYKEEVEQQVPYSKITGQRLLKKVKKVWFLDFEAQQSVFFDRLEKHYPNAHLQSLYQQFDALCFEGKGEDLPRLMLQGESDFSPLSLEEILPKSANILDSLLLYLQINHYLGSRITLEEIIDLLYLLPQKLWNAFADAMQEKKADIFAFQQQVQNLDSDQLLELIQAQLASSSWISLGEKNAFHLDTGNLKNAETITYLQLDQSFLTAMHLRNLQQEYAENLAFFEPYHKMEFAILLFLQFLSASEKKIGIVRQLSDLSYQETLSEKLLNLAKEYSRDAVYLTLAQQEKIEEKNLTQSQAYLQHFRNLFKFLSEHQAFDQKPRNASIQAIDMRAYSQREELFDLYQKFQKSWKQLPSFLQQLQAFSRGQFSWYLDFLKNEKNANYQVAAEIFMQMLQVLQTYCPYLTQQILQILKKPIEELVSGQKLQGKKDYQLHLLFEIIKGIAQQKHNLAIKKHQHLHLRVQANPERISLLEEYASLLQILLKVDTITPLSPNETFPTSVEKFQLLDMTFACQLVQEEKKLDDLEVLEKQYQEQQKAMEYIRQTLMMLSTSPIPQSEKLREKEQELQTLKDELEILEIKIKKLKMQKK